jgi:elongation factor G
MSEVAQYTPDLRPITSGRGEFQMEFLHYDELPSHLADRVVKEAKAAAEAAHKA